MKDTGGLKWKSGRAREKGKGGGQAKGRRKRNRSHYREKKKNLGGQASKHTSWVPSNGPIDKRTLKKKKNWTQIV